MVTVLQAEQAGLDIELEGNEVVVRGPKARAHLVEELRRHRADVVAMLRGLACYRCGAQAGRMVSTYWTLWRRSLCPLCVDVMVQEFDEHGTWPAFPTELISDQP